ncbi:MAG: transposase [Bradymonadia bacterium]
MFTGPTDMRKGFDGLGALVTASGLDVFSGHLFVFVSRRADRVKVLTWQRGGFVLHYKRLEKGCFRRPVVPSSSERVGIGADQLQLLLEGFDTRKIRTPQRWEPKRIDTSDRS